jgi:hypothetical protein
MQACRNAQRETRAAVQPDRYVLFCNGPAADPRLQKHDLMSQHKKHDPNCHHLTRRRLLQKCDWHGAAGKRGNSYGKAHSKGHSLREVLEAIPCSA